MSRSPQKLWLLFTLLLLRLLLGESVHAVSMTTMPVETPNSSATGCPDHLAVQTHQDSDRGHDDGSAPTESCEQGACECPCWHASALVVDVDVFASHRISETLAVLQTDATPQGRPNSPFRPPA